MNRPSIDYDSDSDDDAIGALIYQSSLTAKAREAQQQAEEEVNNADEAAVAAANHGTAVGGTAMGTVMSSMRRFVQTNSAETHSDSASILPRIGSHSNHCNNKDASEDLSQSQVTSRSSCTNVTTVDATNDIVVCRGKKILPQPPQPSTDEQSVAADIYQDNAITIAIICDNNITTNHNRIPGNDLVLPSDQNTSQKFDGSPKEEGRGVDLQSHPTDDDEVLLAREARADVLPSTAQRRRVRGKTFLPSRESVPLMQEEKNSKEGDGLEEGKVLLTELQGEKPTGDEFSEKETDGIRISRPLKKEEEGQRKDERYVKNDKEESLIKRPIMPVSMVSGPVERKSADLGLCSTTTFSKKGGKGRKQPRHVNVADDKERRYRHVMKRLQANKGAKSNSPQRHRVRLDSRNDEPSSKSIVSGNMQRQLPQHEDDFDDLDGPPSLLYKRKRKREIEQGVYYRRGRGWQEREPPITKSRRLCCSMAECKRHVTQKGVFLCKKHLVENVNKKFYAATTNDDNSDKVDDDNGAKETIENSREFEPSNANIGSQEETNGHRISSPVGYPSQPGTPTSRDQGLRSPEEKPLEPPVYPPYPPPRYTAPPYNGVNEGRGSHHHHYHHYLPPPSHQSHPPQPQHHRYLPFAPYPQSYRPHHGPPPPHYSAPPPAMPPSGWYPPEIHTPVPDIYAPRNGGECPSHTQRRRYPSNELPGPPHYPRWWKRSSQSN